MTEFVATSGATVVINPAEWEKAKELKKAIQRVLNPAEILALLGGDVVSIIKAALLADSDNNVEAALFACLARCLRNSEKIVVRTFDDVEARKDYYDIMFACGKENLNPLFASLFSKLSLLSDKPKQAESAQS